MAYNPVIKHNNTFMYARKMPDRSNPKCELDIYQNDTRLVKELFWKIKDGAMQSLHLGDLGLSMIGGEADITFKAWVWENCVTLHWHGVKDKPVTIDFAPDASDIFELRQMIETLDRKFDIVENSHSVSWSYDGLDHIRRGARIEFDPNATIRLTNPDQSSFQIEMTSSNDDLYLIIQCHTSSIDTSRQFPQLPPREKLHSMDVVLQEFAEFKKQFKIDDNLNFWTEQAVVDMFILRGFDQEDIRCFHAGLPGFCCLFGRDSLITAEQSLNVTPVIAQAALTALALTQADSYDDTIDAEPGKMVHERRHAERCNLKAVPYGRYYGGIDTTLLYISLAARYAQKTKDAALIKQLERHILSAIDWMLTHLEAGPYITYRANKEAEGKYGLDEKGWKDGSPILHADSRHAKHPIALCEVQGYAYRALKDAAWMFENILTSKKENAVDLLERADRLKKQFNQDFWCEEIGTYALALDGDMTPCRVVTTNPGHLLRTGIIDHEDKIRGIAATMADPEQLFSGWGLRTLSKKDRSFDPSSYQLGGVWPHDTAECARGLRHVGYDDIAIKLEDALYKLALTFKGRLPELIGGHPRQGDEVHAYFHGCSPQAWSSSLAFALGREE